jgi:hypothetical protein
LARVTAAGRFDEHAWPDELIVLNIAGYDLGIYFPLRIFTMLVLDGDHHHFNDGAC